MEAVATTGGYGFSIVNNSLQRMLTDEVKIAFDNATGNEIFFRKYKVEKFEGRVRCIVKRCKTSLHSITQFQKHCAQQHEIFMTIRDNFILHLQSKQREIADFDMSSEDAGSIKYLPESVSVSNDCVKAASIIGESSFPITDNLQDFLKDEVINAFKNYKDDNNYGSKYKMSIVDNQYECIIKGCDRSYQYAQNLRHHCLFDHNIRLMTTDRYIVAIEKLKLSEPSVCRECNKQSIHRGALKRHYSRVHGIECKLSKNGALLFTTEIGNKLSKTNEPDTDKVQDNTNATKTTTNNMASTRKRSHATAIHEEESNAKKASLNPSDFDDRFLDSITADDSFVTPDAGNIDSINTNSNSSVTTSSISNDCVEGLDFGDRFLDSITADSFVIPTVSDNAPINTDSQSYATPIVISDDNVTSFSWCDDYSSR
jgi:hypothetical protein